MKKQEIKFDERNYRKHSKKNKALIKKSLEELGEFVQIRLANFHRIRFDKVADYYARADERTKKLFRQLALVFDITGTTFEKDIETAYNVGLAPDAYDE